MRNCLTLALAVLTACPAYPQWSKYNEGKMSMISVNAGMSIPFLCFGSSNLHKSTSGFAKTGYSLRISYGYHITRHAGLELSLFYNRNEAGNSQVSTGGKGYRYFGLMGGPLLCGRLGDKLYGDIAVKGGIAKLMTPRLSSGEELLLDNEKATSFVWGGGIGLQYDLSGKSYFRLAADHVNMKPQFNRKPGEPGKTEQHIVALDLSAGVGIRF